MISNVDSRIAPDLKVEIPATDGYCLIGALFKPEGNLDRSVVIAPAMGVGQTYYHDFARFLASRGFTVLTFDYRGIGASAHEPVRASQAGLYDWGRTDISGVLSWLATNRPEDHLLYVGHSVGIQALGLTPEIQKIQGLVAVAAPNGHWRLWSGWERMKLLFWWYATIPVLTRIFGYFPARLLGLGLDLPEGIARDWSRWARTPGYVVDEAGRPVLENFRSFRSPILAFSFTDDRLAISRAVTELLKGFAHASVDHRHIQPAQIGIGSIGHMGFFRETEAIRTSLWRETADWLAEV